MQLYISMKTTTIINYQLYTPLTPSPRDAAGAEGWGARGDRLFHNL